MKDNEIIATDIYNLLKYVHYIIWIDLFKVQCIFIIINYNCFVSLPLNSEEISKPVRYRCASSGIDRNVMVHFYPALLLFVRYLFAFSVLYYSNFTYVWETRIFDEAGSRWCLKNARLGSSLFPSVSKSTGICNWNFRGSISLPRTNSNFTVAYAKKWFRSYFRRFSLTSYIIMKKTFVALLIK